MSTPSPAEAREALARVREVRLDAAQSLRTPWWLWAAAGAVVAPVLAANDFGSAAVVVANLGFGALAVAWVVAGRRSPRVAAASGTLHRSALPGYAWLPVVLVGLIVVVVEHFAGPAVYRMLTGSGMPAWIREHPYTTVALPYALLSVAVGLLISAVLRRLARRAATR
ncbi:hypothetical protein OG500_00415 [Kitasatospora sp. NBC_01250]|uniref:hypothetical protein n=1 Tax=unclassified Kitasatospora TaxID=2633591 RepID=UPI002E108A70|nr:MULTISPECIES: hypothetical protein [unclassified Kitasatospora]WSJ64669.1 hypothetical protein OG294_00335 [Kitasatospora sp. NBC_01302]